MRFALSLGLLLGSAHGWLASEGLATGLLVLNHEANGSNLQHFSAFGSNEYILYP
ncbi:putative conserved secreted protein [Synechococcus sp. NOUM97013]|nr:putative conserved secreted protein [Synechococcus sp. NOUM97013]